MKDSTKRPAFLGNVSDGINAEYVPEVGAKGVGEPPPPTSNVVEEEINPPMMINDDSTKNPEINGLSSEDNNSKSENPSPQSAFEESDEKFLVDALKDTVDSIDTVMEQLSAELIAGAPARTHEVYGELTSNKVSILKELKDLHLSKKSSELAERRVRVTEAKLGLDAKKLAQSANKALGVPDGNEQQEGQSMTPEELVAFMKTTNAIATAIQQNSKSDDLKPQKATETDAYVVEPDDKPSLSPYNPHVSDDADDDVNVGLVLEPTEEVEHTTPPKPITTNFFKKTS